MATWEQRRIGRTNLHVTSLGLGTATMGGSRVPMTIDERVKLVDAAWNGGVRYVDTAPFYGVGPALPKTYTNLTAAVQGHYGLRDPSCPPEKAKALEEQIFTKDLPLIAEHLGLEPDAALGKGLGNYLCLRRWIASYGAGLADPDFARLASSMLLWLPETETGLISNDRGR